MYYVYILKSSKDASKYIGLTEDLKRRLKEHNNGNSTYTSAKQPCSQIKLRLINLKSILNQVQVMHLQINT